MAVSYQPGSGLVLHHSGSCAAQPGRFHPEQHVRQVRLMSEGKNTLQRSRDESVAPGLVPFSVTGHNVVIDGSIS